MSLRMSLLALLAAGPMTGYDLSRQFSSSVGFVWHAADSQIYPELRRMSSEGLLDAEQVPWGTRGATKTQYSVNEAGKEALRTWQNSVQPYVPDRDPARLKAAYFEWATPEAAIAQLNAHIRHFEEQRLQAQNQIDELSLGKQVTISRRLSHYPEAQHERIVRFKIFAYEGKRARAEQEITWAKKGIKLVSELAEGPHDI